MIALNYINKSSAAIAAMKDYENMKLIIENTSKEVKDAYDDMFSLCSAKIDGMPKMHNPKAGEIKVVGSLDKINVMQERYHQAVEYMAWFEPVWCALSDEERIILREFYMQNSQRSGATTRLSHNRILALRYIGGLSWNQVAASVHEGLTGKQVRKLHNYYLSDLC